jgi:hypothetical protein
MPGDGCSTRVRVRLTITRPVRDEDFFERNDIRDHERGDGDAGVTVELPAGIARRRVNRRLGEVHGHEGLVELESDRRQDLLPRLLNRSRATGGPPAFTRSKSARLL